MLEFDWFKYVKPTITQRQNFDRDSSIKVKLQILFSMTKEPVSFQGFVEYLSTIRPNYNSTDYK